MLYNEHTARAYKRTLSCRNGLPDNFLSRRLFIADLVLLCISGKVYAITEKRLRPPTGLAINSIYFRLAINPIQKNGVLSLLVPTSWHCRSRAHGSQQVVHIGMSYAVHVSVSDFLQ